MNNSACFFFFYPEENGRMIGGTLGVKIVCVCVRAVTNSFLRPFFRPPLISVVPPSGVRMAYTRLSAVERGGIWRKMHFFLLVQSVPSHATHLLCLCFFSIACFCFSSCFTGMHRRSGWCNVQQNIFFTKKIK